MDLQFLPYIVVTNPYIKRVYNAYHHAFNTLRQMPEASQSAKDVLPMHLPKARSE